jgi:hypothetical protein
LTLKVLALRACSISPLGKSALMRGLREGPKELAMVRYASLGIK